MKLLQFLIVLCFTISFGFPEKLAAEEKATFHIPALYHVGFWVSDISKARKFYHDFLGYDEPYSLLTPQGALQMAVMKVNEDQVIYLFPNPKKILPNGDNLDHLGLIVDDAQALFNRFVESGLKVKPVHKARIGDTILTCSDPDGHIFEIKPHGAKSEKEHIYVPQNHTTIIHQHDEEYIPEAFHGPEAGSGTGDSPMATNDSKPVKLAKYLAVKTADKMKNEMLGKMTN